jgi:hypothetical protein
MHILNRRPARDARHGVPLGRLTFAALLSLSVAAGARAQFVGSASATTQFESNSNVFDLNSGIFVPGISRRSSTDFAYGAGFDSTYTWSRQQLYASANTRQLDYQQLPQLNHNEYNIDAGLLWALGGSLDGKLDVTRSHTMVPFLDLVGPANALSLLTDQTETFKFDLRLDPEWKLEGVADTSKETQPTPGAANQELTQSSGTASIDYQGFGPVTSGLTGGYLTGTYAGSGSAFNSSFRQFTAGFLANYKLSRTAFDGQVTYTRRTSDGTGSDNLSGLTGLLDFKDQLTPKTSLTLKIERDINTYYLNLGSEIDSSAGLAVNWQATYRTAISLGYTFTYRAFPGQVQGSRNAYPVQYEQNATLGISYRPVRWLTINPYANILTRRSNTLGLDFSSDVYGISLTATVGDTKAK